jgi:hypothetical protein
MNIYKQSTQKNSWIFNEISLTQIQAMRFSRGLSILEELKKQNDKISLKSVKPEEEKTIITYYTNQIAITINNKKLSSSLKVITTYIVICDEFLQKILSKKDYYRL